MLMLLQLLQRDRDIGGDDHNSKTRSADGFEKRVMVIDCFTKTEQKASSFL